MQQIHSKAIIPVICTLLLQLRLTNEEPDEVGVVLDEKVIQIHQAGESAFIVFGSMPLHGYRQSVCCLKLKNYNISMAALHRNKNKIETRHARRDTNCRWVIAECTWNTAAYRDLTIVTNTITVVYLLKRTCLIIQSLWYQCKLLMKLI